MLTRIPIAIRCHTSCDLLDAGSLSSWLGEVRSWMESNPNDVVTVLLVNGAQASVSDLAAQYSAAGITTSLAYTPSSSNARNQTWPTLQSLITSGTRLLNFVDYGVDDNSAAPYIMPEYSYIFENPYDITSSSAFSCEANRPTKFVDNTGQALSNGLMPLMNHFLDNEAGFGIEQPAVSNTPTTNAPSGGIGTLGYSATQCTQEYGRPPTYVLVDYFVSIQKRSCQHTNTRLPGVSKRRKQGSVLQLALPLLPWSGFENSQEFKHRCFLPKLCKEACIAHGEFRLAQCGIGASRMLTFGSQ